MKEYNQLSLEQRYNIECLLGQGYNQSQIAGAIGVHRSTISREFRRNVSHRGRYANEYCANRANDKAEQRHRNKDKLQRWTDEMFTYMRNKLRKERWSPEFISARGKMDLGDFVSHEAIYQYIWMTKKSHHRAYDQDRDLHKYLRCHKRRQKRKNDKQNWGCIPNRVPISERPSIVEQRTRMGDLEIDLMMGSKHRPGLIVITDRATIETKLIKVTTKKSKTIAKKITNKLMADKKEIHTITFDNDLAFTQHQKVSKLLESATYFTRPYTSWDKGTVENRIGVIRRFFPKGIDMEKVHANTIKSVERKLNNRPVRKFNYLTPYEKKKLLLNVALMT